MENIEKTKMSPKYYWLYNGIIDFLDENKIDYKINIKNNFEIYDLKWYKKIINDLDEIINDLWFKNSMVNNIDFFNNKNCIINLLEDDNLVIFYRWKIIDYFRDIVRKIV